MTDLATGDGVRQWFCIFIEPHAEEICDSSPLRIWHDFLIVCFG
jgi:hypothetical protein